MVHDDTQCTLLFTVEFLNLNPLWLEQFTPGVRLVLRRMVCTLCASWRTQISYHNCNIYSSHFFLAGAGTNILIITHTHVYDNFTFVGSLDAAHLHQYVCPKLGLSATPSVTPIKQLMVRSSNFFLLC